MDFPVTPDPRPVCVSCGICHDCGYVRGDGHDAACQARRYVPLRLLPGMVELHLVQGHEVKERP
jgi:hypothetical protein